MTSAELVGALHTWRLQLADITQMGEWPVALAEDMLRRADAQVVFPFTISVRSSAHAVRSRAVMRSCHRAAPRLSATIADHHSPHHSPRARVAVFA